MARTFRQLDPPIESLNDPSDPSQATHWLDEIHAQYDEIGQPWTAKETNGNGLRWRQAHFLAAYVRSGAKIRAAAAARVSTSTTLKWRKEDPIFQPVWAIAEVACSEVLQAEVRRRAVEGVCITIRDKHGNVIGEERKYSDAMLMFLVKGYDPERRWVAKSESGAVTDDAWRQRLAKMVDDPKALAALEVLADHMVAEVQPEVVE